MAENRRQFRLPDEVMRKLDEITKYYFGTVERNRTAALKMIIEKEYKKVKESNQK